MSVIAKEVKELCLNSVLSSTTLPTTLDSLWGRCAELGLDFDRLIDGGGMTPSELFTVIIKAYRKENKRLRKEFESRWEQLELC